MWKLRQDLPFHLHDAFLLRLPPFDDTADHSGRAVHVRVPCPLRTHMDLNANIRHPGSAVEE